MKERLLKFLAYLGIGQKKFEQNTGLSNGFVNSVKDNITLKSLNKISAAYPELNTDWLQTGNGEMIAAPKPPPIEDSIAKIAEAIDRMTQTHDTAIKTNQNQQELIAELTRKIIELTDKKGEPVRESRRVL